MLVVPEQRIQPRFVTNQTIAAVRFENSQPTTARIRNISSSGACLFDIKESIGNAGHLSLMIKSPHIQPKYKFKVTRSDSNKGTCAIQFDNLVKNDEMASLINRDRANPLNNTARQVASRDHDEIYHDVRAIQNCRSNIFMGTLVAIFTAAFTTVTFYFGTKTEMPDSWLCVISGLVFIFLSIGILSIMEKARAINCRQAYMAALESHLQQDTLPGSYPGWSQLHHCQAECGNFFKQNNLPDSDSCGTIRIMGTPKWSKYKSMLPSLLDSFTSLSAWIFFILYGVVSVVLIWSVWNAVDNTWQKSSWSSIVAASVGLAVSGLAAWLVMQLRWLRKGKYSYEAYYLAWMKTIRGCRCALEMHGSFAI